MTIHALQCDRKLIGHSDAAKRISDTYNLHRMAGGYDVIGKWFAAALHDGRTDDVLYNTKREAVRHQHHNEQWYTFICIRPNSMSVCDAEVMLTISRRYYDAGLRLPDPEDTHGGRELIRRLTVEDQRNLAGGRATNLKFPRELE